MSNFRFGADDYKLSYYPPEASDGIGGVDWDKVESVEIEFDVYVKERTCEFAPDGMMDDRLWFSCSNCGGYITTDYGMPSYCPHCGAKVVGE